jgi:hypothetical protein
MEASRGLAYGLGLSQGLAILGVVLFLPPPEVIVYNVQARAVNGTAVLGGPNALLSNKVGPCVPMLQLAVVGAMFSTVTYRMREEGLSGIDFTQDALDQAGMWDMLFWVHCLGVHCLVFAMVATPVSAFGWIAATCFTAYFLFRVCAPKPSTPNMTQENLNILGYFIGVAMAGYQIPPHAQGDGATVLMSLIVLDYFLGVGHTWDRQATIDTVTNCRLFYLCCSSFGVALLYSIKVG